jgi:hypothetical protein
MHTNVSTFTRPSNTARVLAALGAASFHLDDLLASVPSVTHLGLVMGAAPDDIVAAFVCDMDEYVMANCAIDERCTAAMEHFQLQAVGRLCGAVREAAAADGALLVATA